MSEKQVEAVARAMCEAEGVDPDLPCPGIGNLIPVGETWPAWKVRVPQARAVLALPWLAAALRLAEATRAVEDNRGSYGDYNAAADAYRAARRNLEEEK